MGGLGRRLRAPGANVERHGDGQARHQDPDEGQQGGRPSGPGHHDQEADGQGQRPGALLVGDVNGRAGVMAEQRRQGHEDLAARHHEQAQPSDHGRGGPRSWLYRNAKVAPGFERRHDLERQVGDRFGQPHPGRAGHGDGLLRPRPAGRAGRQVRIDRGRLEPRVLTVDPSRDGLPVGVAVHAR